MSFVLGVRDVILEWFEHNYIGYAAYKVFLVVLLASCAISLIYIASKSVNEQQKWLVLTSMGFFMILLSYYGEVTSNNIYTMVWMVKMGHISKILSTLCFLKYASGYCKEKIPVKLMNAYYCYTIFIGACVLFANKIPYFYKSYTIKYFGGIPCFSANYGFLFYMYSGSLCAAIFVVLFMIVKRMGRVNYTEKKQLRFLFFTGLLPVLGYALTLSLPFPMFDFVPVSFGISALLLYIASKQHGLLDVVLSAKENIIENTKEGIVVVDNEYNVLYANIAATYLIDHVFDNKEGEELEAFMHLFQKEKNLIELKDGMYEVSVSDIYENTKLRGKMAWFFDVTEAQEYTKEILQLKDEAERANIAKSAFLANMSHEIRTPMNAILGFSELVIQQEKEESLKDYMYDIKRSAKSLLHIINQILDISKIESGEIEMVQESFYLQTVLEEVLAIITNQANKKGLKCSANFADDLPSEFYGAHVQLREILINILNNGVKYTKEGEVALKVYCEDIEEDVTNIYFEVSDTGIGMRKEDVNCIYDRFRKLDSMQNQGIEGTGLGMYIVKSLVTRMQGTIDIDSVYGEGTTIKITIPMKVTNRTPMGKLDVNSIEEKKNRKKIIINAKILVVDDNEVNLKLISSLLLRYHTHADLAISGEQAIEKVQNETYDLIFMDHMMPEMDGVQAMQKIRELDDGKYKEIPIILLTANAIAGFREEMLNIGFEDYISKPIDIAYLEKALMKYLPEEKITILEEEANEDGSSDVIESKITEMKKVLKHFQVDEGIKYSGGSYEDYLEVLKITQERGVDRSEKLQKLFDDKDYSSYTIHVHALKSTAYNIGAMELGDEAQAQEMAGKNENYKYIEERFAFLMEEYQIVLLEIQKWFFLNRAEVEPVLLEDELVTEVLSDEDKKEILAAVDEQMKAFQLDNAQQILEEMIPMLQVGEERTYLEKIVKALVSCDMETASKLWRERSQ